MTRYQTDAGIAGTIYLIHFDRPLHHARHYLGWSDTAKLPERLNAHARGTGSRLLRALKANGIGWRVVRTLPGSRKQERYLKDQKNTARWCPECQRARASQ